MVEKPKSKGKKKISPDKSADDVKAEKEQKDLEKAEDHLNHTHCKRLIRKFTVTLTIRLGSHYPYRFA